MFARICSCRLIYAAPLTFSLTLTNYNRLNNNDHSKLLENGQDNIDDIIDLEDKTVITDSNEMEFQLNEIHPKLTGTFRSDITAYIFQQWEQNKSISEIFNDLYTKYPTVIAEFSLMVGGGIMSAFGLYYGKQKMRSLWFNRNFYNTINISLNTFDTAIPSSLSSKKNQIPNFLSSVNFNVRTVSHSQIHELIPNAEGAKYLMQAATDQGNCIIQCGRFVYVQQRILLWFISYCR